MRTDITTTNPFTPVKLEPVFVAGKEINKRSVVVQDDEGNFTPVSVVGPDYNLVPNEICRQVMADVMSRSPYEWRDLKTMWDGKRYTHMSITQSHLTTISNGHEHPIHLGIMTRNSYDGTSAFSFEMYACNMVCTNQYIARNLFGFFALRHTDAQYGQWDINDALENIGTGAENLMQVAPRIKALMGEPLTLEHLFKARHEIALPDTYWADVMDKLETEPRTRFGLFQALTSVTSHDLTGPNSIRIGDQVGTFFLN